MKFLSVRGKLVNDEINIQLDRPCRCLVALAEFFLPSIEDKNGRENNVDIFCEQIDSSFDNPSRLLKRLISNHNRSHQFYNCFEAKWFDFKVLDSQDKFLTLKIKRTNGKEMIFKSDSEIFLTLAFKNDTDDMWIRI